MIHESTVYEKLYCSQFPDLTLSAIYEIAFPASQVSMRFLGDLSSPVNPFSEAILSLVSCGFETSSQLSSALGVDQDLLSAGLLDLVDNYQIVSDQNFSRFELTEQGNLALQELSMKVPVESEVSQTFDHVTRQLSSATFFSNRDLESKLEGLLSFPESKSVVASATLLELRKLLVRVKVVEKSFIDPEPKVLEISEILSSRIRRKGQTLGKLLVWQDLAAQRIDFMIEIDQKRSRNHEEELRKLGGLKSLKIQPLAISKKEVASIKQYVSKDSPNELDTRNLAFIEEATKRMPDGGSVRPANHKQLLSKAIKDSKKRLLIISPWLNSHVIDWRFLRDLEALLKKRKIVVTIAWGFDDATGKHSLKNNWDVTRNLLRLSNKYSNFTFLKLDQSHMKILVFDNNYICTSHNWLSYSGNQPRMEWGELRTDPSVVTDRYSELLEILPRVGHTVTDADIPVKAASRPKSSHPQKNVRKFPKK